MAATLQNDWKIAVKQGYEIQIDDQGFDQNHHPGSRVQFRNIRVQCLDP